MGLLKNPVNKKITRDFRPESGLKFSLRHFFDGPAVPSFRSKIKSCYYAKREVIAMNKKDIILTLTVAIIGLIIWIGISIVSGQEEAWDSPLFFRLGIPLMLLASFIAGFIRPGKAWLWGLATVILQPLLLFFTSRVGPLIAVGLLFFLFFFGICTVSAFMGGMLRVLIDYAVGESAGWLRVNRYHSKQLEESIQRIGKRKAIRRHVLDRLLFFAIVLAISAVIGYLLWWLAS